MTYKRNGPKNWSVQWRYGKIRRRRSRVGVGRQDGVVRLIRLNKTGTGMHREEVWTRHLTYSWGPSQRSPSSARTEW